MLWKQSVKYCNDIITSSLQLRIACSAAGTAEQNQPLNYIIFIQKALLGKLQRYLLNIDQCTALGDYVVLKIHHMKTKTGRQAVEFYAPQKWDHLQRLRLGRLIPFARFKAPCFSLV